MISRTSALTAGHCVWNTNTRTPLSLSAIAPGRTRDLTKRDGTSEFSGTWQVSHVDMFGAFQQNGQSNFDIAVVTFKPRIRTNDPICNELYVSILSLHVYWMDE